MEIVANLHKANNSWKRVNTTLLLCIYSLSATKPRLYFTLELLSHFLRPSSQTADYPTVKRLWLHLALSSLLEKNLSPPTSGSVNITTWCVVVISICGRNGMMIPLWLWIMASREAQVLFPLRCFFVTPVLWGDLHPWRLWNSFDLSICRLFQFLYRCDFISFDRFPFLLESIVSKM